MTKRSAQKRYEFKFTWDTFYVAKLYFTNILLKSSVETHAKFTCSALDYPKYFFEACSLK